MRKALVALVLFGAIASMGAMQQPVGYSISDALQKLGFKLDPFPQDGIGGPHKFTVTKDVIKKLSDLEGKTIVVDHDGTVKIVKPKK